MALGTRIRTFTTNVVIPISTTNGPGAAPLLNGVLRTLSITPGTMTGTTFTVTIYGPGGVAGGIVLFTKAGLSVSGVTNLLSDGTNIPLAGIAVSADSIIVITSNATEAAARTIPVTALIER